jgi:hypothetical protein
MQAGISRPRRLRWAFALAATVVAAAAMVSFALGGTRAEATAPCVGHANTDEELTFLSLLQNWRYQYIPGTNPSYPMQISAPLNAAAAGYARFLADHPGTGGHAADGADGFPWATRAIACGYPLDQAAGGEGLAIGNNAVSAPITPVQALTLMTAESFGGIRVPADVGMPVRCLGAAHAVSEDGTREAWVTLLFGASGACPQSVILLPPSPSPSLPFTRTATNTPTRTATPTKTPAKLPTRPPSLPGLNYQAFGPAVAFDSDFEP